MTLAQLQQLALAGDIHELNLLSLEGGFYVLQALTADGNARLEDDRARVLHLRSLEHARFVLREVPELPLYLVQFSAHDEMVGMAPRSESPLKVKVSTRAVDG
jgi:hypothetical protein